jgi:hypothetical protein
MEGTPWLLLQISDMMIEPQPPSVSLCPHLQPKVGTAFRCWRQTLNPNAHPLWKAQKADNDTHKSAEWSPQRKGGGRENGNSLVSLRGESLCLSHVCVSLSHQAAGR